MSELIIPTLDDEKPQPSMSSVKAACILFPGPVLTFRAFKQSATRSMRGIADAEFQEAISLLEIAGMGNTYRIRVPRTPNLVTVFVKKNPDKINWPSDLCSQSEYRQRYNLSAHRSITTAIKRELIANSYVPEDMFERNE